MCPWICSGSWTLRSLSSAVVRSGEEPMILGILEVWSPFWRCSSMMKTLSEVLCAAVQLGPDWGDIFSMPSMGTPGTSGG